MKHKPEDIITTGQELFRTYGYHGTGVSEILEASGVPKGTFYNYFDSKEHFAICCLENYSSQIKKLISTYMGFTSQSPKKRLRSYFEQLIRINQNEGADKGCLLMNFSVELAGQNSKIAKIVENEYMNWISLLEPIVLEAQEQGELTKDMSAIQIALLLYYNTYGGFTEMKAIRSTKKMHHSLLNIFRLLEV